MNSVGTTSTLSCGQSKSFIDVSKVSAFPVIASVTQLLLLLSINKIYICWSLTNAEMQFPWRFFNQFPRFILTFRID